MFSSLISSSRSFSMMAAFPHHVSCCRVGLRPFSSHLEGPDGRDPYIVGDLETGKDVAYCHGNIAASGSARLAGEMHHGWPEENWRQLATSQELISESASELPYNKLEALRKRLHWAACKRGWNEMGILLESFLQSDVGSLADMDSKDLIQLHRLLQCDDMFLTDLISGRKSIPAELDSDVLARLIEHSKWHQVES